MNLSDTAQAILLLTAYFPGETGGEKPLTPTEWGQFAGWLHQKGLQPGDLTSMSMDDALSNWDDKKITGQRLERLLNRGSALALAMEKWSRAGLWVMTRQDEDYPVKLKKQLGRAAPPVFFGSGNSNLVGRGGLAVVGSRKAISEDLEFARQLGQRAAETGLSVISGGAQGIDEAAMLGGLEAEGTAVGVLANDLLRASASRSYRRHLRDGNLVLLCPFNPEARFQVGNAMQRNRYIYCLSDGAVAVHAGPKGGTRAGAEENLKRGWVPMWVKQSDDPEASNGELVQQGASEVPKEVSQVDICTLVGRGEPAASGSDQGQTAVTAPEKKDPVVSQNTEQSVDAADEARPGAGTEGQPHAPFSSCSIYEQFLGRLEEVCSDTMLKKDEIVEEIMRAEADSSLTKKQITVWIDQACQEGRLKKYTRPVRYQWGGAQQLSFDA